jgi:hypothetical protein
MPLWRMRSLWRSIEERLSAVPFQAYGIRCSGNVVGRSRRSPLNRRPAKSQPGSKGRRCRRGGAAGSCRSFGVAASAGEIKRSHRMAVGGRKTRTIVRLRAAADRTILADAGVRLLRFPASGNISNVWAWGPSANIQLKDSIRSR